MLRLLKVRGNSLCPDFLEGDYVLSAKVPFPAGRIRAGDVIVFRQPGYNTLMIKRVDQVLDQGKSFRVRGTQIDSTDSRDFGPVARDHLIGRVIWHIRQRKTSKGT